jgi:hypothetical protein
VAPASIHPAYAAAAAALNVQLIRVPLNDKLEIDPNVCVCVCVCV